MPQIMFRPLFIFIAILLALFTGSCDVSPFQTTLLNVSYDPTRAFYDQYNKLFSQHYSQSTGSSIRIVMSHAGSGKQARAVIDGLPADVVSLAIPHDIDEIAKRGKLQKDWSNQFPHQSSPYTSTIVFLVRAGNPKNIQNWSDLIRPGTSVILPNPKTSGGARYIYLAAWGQALIASSSSSPEEKQAEARAFVAALLKNVPVLDAGARGSTNTFVTRKMGDVLLTWENEAHLVKHELGKENFEIVTPPLSILATPPVAVVDRTVDRRKTRKAAQMYVDFLYSDSAQELIAKHHFRPLSPESARSAGVAFPDLRLFTVEEFFESWDKAHQTHFATGAIFDQIMLNR